MTTQRSNPALIHVRQPRVGFVLSDEQFRAPELLEPGVAAEQAGFDRGRSPGRLALAVTASRVPSG
ncbi:MAG TPA: hypothetical protein VF763_00345 [Candidatus Limnocylindrales bacterium]